jgi:hypothetical protein
MAATVVAAKGWIPRRGKRVAAPGDPFVPSFWESRRKNPELAKALAVVQRYVGEARNLLDLDDEQAPLRTAEVRERLRDLLTRDVERVSIDSAWELANQLKRELLLLADVPYVWAQLEYEAQRDKRADKWHRWSDHFSSRKLHALINARDKNYKTVDRAVQLEAVRSLRKLYELRAEAGLERRARAAQKCRYLTALIPILLTLLVALSATIYEVGEAGIWKEIALAASAGALGATLSGIFRVRDRLVELDDLRSFWPAMRIQPLIGATAGLITLLVLESGAVRLGATGTTPWAARALFTFVAGFSEPFFLGLVQRVAVVPDRDATLPPATLTPSKLAHS